MNQPEDVLVERLDTLVHEHPETDEIVRLYKVILPILRDADLKPAPLMLDGAETARKQREGLPLLYGIDLKLDEWAARDLLIKLARAVEEMSDQDSVSTRWLWFRSDRRRKPRQEENWNGDRVLRATATRHIRLMFENQMLDVPGLLSAAVKGDMATVFPMAAAHQADPGILWTLAHMAIRPALRALREATPISDSQWQYSYCLVCGADATFGELQGNAGDKHLRCGQCGADWRARRLECAHCGNDDAKTLTYLYKEGERDLIRVEVCDNCMGYLKVIASFSPTPPHMLAVQDLATIYLDAIAEAKGYSRKRVLSEDVIPY